MMIFIWGWGRWEIQVQKEVKSGEVGKMLGMHFPTAKVPRACAEPLALSLPFVRPEGIRLSL